MSVMRVFLGCLFAISLISCGGGGDGGEPGEGLHFKVTVTGPGYPDGRELSIAPDAIVSYVGSEVSLLFNGYNDPEPRELISMTMSVKGIEPGTYFLVREEGGYSEFTLGGVDDDRSMKSEGGTITLTAVGDRLVGTIDATLRGTQISRKDEVYSVVGSFNLED